MTITRTFTLVALAALLAAPAFAHGRGGGPGTPDRPGIPSVLHPRGLLGALIFPCPAGCDDDAETCADTAKDTALSCISGACPEQVTAAQTACTTDPRSNDCKTAAGALAACADTCLSDFASANSTCRQTLRDCREACSAE